MRELVFCIVFVLSTAQAGGIYKCVSHDGNTTFQSTPCPLESSKAEELKSAADKHSEVSNGVEGSGGPVGEWVAESNSAFKAQLSKNGRFFMTDHEGNKAYGKWHKSDTGGYVVDLSFQGMSIPIKMEYKMETDYLYLSQIGFPDTLRKYIRN